MRKNRNCVIGKPATATWRGIHEQPIATGTVIENATEIETAIETATVTVIMIAIVIEMTTIESMTIGRGVGVIAMLIISAMLQMLP
jgi:hypothetical protein